MKAMIVVVLIFVSGCAGELYIGARRIDEVQQTQVMKDKPLKCLFVGCEFEGGK